MCVLESLKHTGLSPIIKWAGGKEKELSTIFSNAPQSFENYYEPFVGGGAVFTALPAKKHFINDKSSELIELYQCIASSHKSFYIWIDRIMKSWQQMLRFADTHRVLCKEYLAYREGALSDQEMKSTIFHFIDDRTEDFCEILSPDFKYHRGFYITELKKNLLRKITRMKKIEQERHVLPLDDVNSNIETALMSALYMYFRKLYNDRILMASDMGLRTAVFVFIRNYAYSGMFRYSGKGEFNVPYGGIGYNNKLLTKKIEYYQSMTLLEHFKDTHICNLDFEIFLRENVPTANDFIFLDPPYDSEFSTYAQNEFSQDDQQRLANYLINDCMAKWMLIIKKTPFIYALYDHPQLTIKTFSKKYLVSFMNRNNKDAEHLIIMNY